MAIPGTHRGPVLEHSKEGIFCGAIDPADPLFEKDKAVTLTGKAGSLSIHQMRRRRRLAHQRQQQHLHRHEPASHLA